MPRAERCLSPRCDCMESCAVQEAILEEREACAKIADTGMLVPPDGGSPTQDKIDVAERIAYAIRRRGNQEG